VYLETHCNIGSKRAFTTGVLRTRQVTQLFTYLPTHKLFSSCIRRYLVSYTALGRTSTAAYYWTISDNVRCRKFGLVPFWCAVYSPEERLWYDSNSKNRN